MAGGNKTTGSAGGVALTVMAAFACTFAGNHSCNFLRISGTSNNTSVDVYRGIWRGQAYANAECASYSNSGLTFDRKWNSAKAMVVIADILAGFALFALVPLLLPSMRNKGSLSGIASMAMKACLFQGLTLLILKSREACTVKDVINSTCVIDQGANLSIAATVLWFVAGLQVACTMTAMVMESALEEEKKEEEEQAKEEA